VTLWSLNDAARPAAGMRPGRNGRFMVSAGEEVTERVVFAKYRFRLVHPGELMAGSMVSMAPMLVIFLVLRRRVIEIMALTGIK
jgi:ABC-type glycerol-3-phosphate transport system permease component